MKEMKERKVIEEIVHDIEEGLLCRKWIGPSDGGDGGGLEINLHNYKDLYFTIDTDGERGFQELITTIYELPDLITALKSILEKVRRLKEIREKIEPEKIYESREITEEIEMG